MGWTTTYKPKGEPILNFFIREGVLTWSDDNPNTYRVLDSALVNMRTFYAADSAEEQIKYVLRWQTPFVQNNWLRLEVMVPNRDAYGNLQAGWMGDTGVLLATRQASPVPDNPG